MRGDGISRFRRAGSLAISARSRGAGGAAGVAGGRTPAPAADRHSEAWARLSRIAAEALILQDAAEALLAGFRLRPELSEVARPCGRLKARFSELRDDLPFCGDRAIDRYSRELSQVLTHHILLLKASTDLLVGESRCPRAADELDRIDGLGAPAQRLERLRIEIVNRRSNGELGGYQPLW